MSRPVVCVIGTRPEAIKIAPVAEALASMGIKPLLVVTGQHASLQLSEHGLDIYDTIRVHCPAEADPLDHVRTVTRSLQPHLSGSALVIVQGDTSTALGGALAATAGGVSLAHVEAGLRSHDRRRPWPEEDFRIAIDAQAELLFAPTELSAANLRRERVGGSIYVTGNTAVDAVLRIRRSLPRSCPVQRQIPSIIVTCHRRESWGDGLVAVTAAIDSVVRHGMATVDFILHPNPVLAARVRALLAHRPEVRFRAPLPHREMLEAIVRSDLLLSDSGGVQEEAAALGVPMLVLRDRTERPEAIARGNMRIAGTSAQSVLAALEALIRDPAVRARMTASSDIYGDGNAGGRIAAIIAQWLEERPAGDLAPDRRSATSAPGLQLV